MLVAGGMMTGTGWRAGPMGGMIGTGGWMWGHGVINNWWPWLGIVAGIVMLISAAMLYTRPEQSQGWGIVILIASALNLFIGMGGFLAGVLGIIGGALALAWQPQ